MEFINNKRHNGNLVTYSRLADSDKLVSNIGHIKNNKVAQGFISNPKNKPYVNHINGVKHDNRAVRTPETT
nr:13891_t:CDS:2 [Entrophospora candida]